MYLTEQDYKHLAQQAIGSDRGELTIELGKDSDLLEINLYHALEGYSEVAISSMGQHELEWVYTRNDFIITSVFCSNENGDETTHDLDESRLLAEIYKIA